jgi:DNA-binding MarR family transcriptional regulator
LSTGAVTTVLDRLERAGLARRVTDPADRRRVLAEITPETSRLVEEIYAPLASAGAQELERYSEAELALLRDFLRRGRALQEEHIERVRARLRARQDEEAAS